MTHKTILLIFALALLPGSGAWAQKLYKWIDEQGNVSYHDRPPPADSGYRVEEKSVGSRSRPVTGDDGDATQKAPVVLYAVPKCNSCDLARAHLQKRGIPFTEKNAESDLKVQEELKAKAGGLSVPTIMVGTKVMNGYLESLLDGELDQAGYPKAGNEKPAETPDDTEFKAPTQ